MKMKRYFTSVISLLPAEMIILGENFIWGIVGVTVFDQSAVPTRYKHEKTVEKCNDRINDPI
jgi:hypothetical protein